MKITERLRSPPLSIRDGSSTRRGGVASEQADHAWQPISVGVDEEVQMSGLALGEGHSPLLRLQYAAYYVPIAFRTRSRKPCTGNLAIGSWGNVNWLALFTPAQ